MKKMHAATSYAGGVLAAGILATLLSAPAFANIYDFSTPAGATISGSGAVSASAHIVTNDGGTVAVTLTDLLANPTSAGQLLSDILFTLSGTTSVTTGGQNPSPGAGTSYIDINGSGVATANTTETAVYTLTDTSNVVHLSALNLSPPGGGTGPCCLIIGPGNASGVYSNANNSIASNTPHNPFIQNSATFTLALTGVTAATTVSSVLFSFGTADGTNVAAVPIPAAIWLFGSGLLGLIGIARRKQGVALTASAIPA